MEEGWLVAVGRFVRCVPAFLGIGELGGKDGWFSRGVLGRGSLLVCGCWLGGEISFLLFGFLFSCLY